MFAGYNKNNNEGTLVGNWVEEKCLKEVTGYSRGKDPIEPGRRDTRDRILPMSVIDNENQYETSTNAASKQCTISPPDVAPRSRIREHNLLRKARELHSAKQKERDRQLIEQELLKTTETQASFQPISTDILNSVERIVRTKSKQENTSEKGKIGLTRGELDSQLSHQLRRYQQSSDYTKDIPVTLYSHAITSGSLLNFASTTSDTQNPFNRSSAFTNDIRDPTKRHAEATEFGSSIDNNLGTTTHQRSALCRLVSQIDASQNGNADKRQILLNKLQAAAVNGLLHHADFVSIFKNMESEIHLTANEATYIFMYFDKQHIGMVELEKLLGYLEKACD